MFKLNISTNKPVEIIKLENKICDYSFVMYFKGLVDDIIFTAKIVFLLKIKKNNKFKIENISINKIKFSRKNELLYKKNPYLPSTLLSSSSISYSETNSIEDISNSEKKIFNIVKNIIKDVNLKKSVDNKYLELYLVKSSDIKKLKVKGKYK